MSGKRSKGGKDGKNARPVIIKRYETVEGGHHGGAWKVAYADFVTAMMAFFLLMWLLNATTDAQRRGIADYFSPISAMTRGQSGTGKPFGGKTPFSEGQMVSDLGSVSIIKQAKPPNDNPDDEPPIRSQPQRTADAGQGAGAEDSDNPGRGPTGEAMAGTAHAGDQHSGEALAQSNAVGGPSLGNPSPGSAAQATPTDPATTPTAAALAMAMNAATDAAANGAKPADAAAAAAAAPRSPEQEQAAFNAAAQQIREAVGRDPDLSDTAKQMSIDITAEGLRIQLLDEEKRSMFQLGSATLNDRARSLLQKVAPALAKLSESISVTGHTDAAPFVSRDRSNWELSAERALATRRLLADAGLPDVRFRSVVGDADRDPLLPADPLNPANRRIAIMVLRRLPPPGTRGSQPLTPEGAANAARTLSAPLPTALPYAPALGADPAAPSPPRPATLPADTGAAATRPIR